MIHQDSVYRIGKLGKPHGIKGEISFLFTDDIFDRAESDHLILLIDGILVPFFMEEYRFRSDEAALVKFVDIDTQERAAELTGSEVYFSRSMAEEESDETSLAQIVGFEIVDEHSGKSVGQIERVDDTTDNVLFELANGTLIPVAHEWIKAIDTVQKQIVMELPDGLLDL